MIPETLNDAVQRALREAFGVTTLDAISELTGGHTSSLVFRVVVRGTPYVMKIITRPDDPSRHYESMRAAANAGVAPGVLYTNAEDKISITEFIHAVPLPRSTALAEFPARLRALHALPPFSRAPFNTTCTFLLGSGPMLDGFLQTCRTAGILPPAELQDCVARLEELVAVYPFGDAAMVASHNDVLKPDNFLFDGQRVWLVDWEAACLNDRYADLAVAANLIVGSDDDETAYLREYFGREPDAYERARFHLMQQISHVFYAMTFLLLSSPAGQPLAERFRTSSSTDEPPSDSPPVPYAEFQRRVWTHEVDLADRHVKQLYGQVHWRRLQENVRQPRYQDALRQVAERRA
jgi:aminoglycoside phosphotransferase (APT) family kinase protein